MQSLSNKTKSYGFSLIEILLVAVTMMVLLGGGISAYVSFTNRQNIITAGKNFVVILRDTQKRAQSGEKPSFCVDADEELSGWRINKTGDAAYEVIALCDGTEVPGTRASYNLDEGIFFGDWDVDEITFEVVTGSVTGASQVLIQNDVDSPDYVYTIKVSSVGGIDDEGIY